MKLRYGTLIAIMFSTFCSTIVPAENIKKWAQREYALTSSEDYLRNPKNVAHIKSFLETSNLTDNQKTQWQTKIDSAKDMDKLTKIMQKQSPTRAANWFAEAKNANYLLGYKDFHDNVIAPIHINIDPTKNQDFDLDLEYAIKKISAEYEQASEKFDQFIQNAIETEETDSDLPIEGKKRRKFRLWLTKSVRLKDSIESSIADDRSVDDIQPPLVPYELYLAEIGYLEQMVATLKSNNKLNDTTANNYKQNLIDLSNAINLNRLYDAESLLFFANEIVRDSINYLVAKQKQESILVRQIKSKGRAAFERVSSAENKKERKELREQILTPNDLQKIYQRFLQAIKLTQIAYAQKPQLDRSYYFDLYEEKLSWIDNRLVKLKIKTEFPLLKEKILGARKQAIRISILTTNLGYLFTHLFAQMARYTAKRYPYIEKNNQKNYKKTMLNLGDVMIEVIKTYLQDYKFWIEFNNIITKNTQLHVTDIEKLLGKIDIDMKKQLK